MRPDDLTPAEQVQVQRWIAARTWQTRWPLAGRRWRDKKVQNFRGNLERYIQWQIDQEPWRRLRGT